MSARLDGHGSHDGPLVAFQGLQSHLLDVALGFAQELLAGSKEHFLVLALNLDLPRNKSAIEMNERTNSGTGVIILLT